MKYFILITSLCFKRKKKSYVITKPFLHLIKWNKHVNFNTNCWNFPSCLKKYLFTIVFSNWNPYKVHILKLVLTASEICFHFHFSIWRSLYQYHTNLINTDLYIIITNLLRNISPNWFLFFRSIMGMFFSPFSI